MMTFLNIFLALSVIASWGINSSIGKLGVSQVPPVGFLALRYLLTALLFLPFAKVRKNQLLPLAITAFFTNVLHNGACYISFTFLPVTSYSVLIQTQVPISIAAACFFSHEKVTSTQIMGTFIALAGVLCVFGVPELNFWGVFFVFVGAVSWAAAQLYMKKLRDVSATTFMAYTSLFSVPFLGIASAIFEPDFFPAVRSADTAILMFTLFWLVVILAFAMLIWQRLLATEGINKLSPFLTLQIVFSILGGVFIMHETMTPQIWFGSVLTIIGVALTTITLKGKHA